MYGLTTRCKGTPEMELMTDLFVVLLWSMVVFKRFGEILSITIAFQKQVSLTSQYSSSGVIESLNDLYLDSKSTQNSQKLNVSKN